MKFLKKGYPVLSETKTIADGATETFKAKEEQFIDAWHDVPAPGGKQISTGLVFDPAIISPSFAALLTDSIYNNTCYNNLIITSANTALPGLDLGVPKTISQADLYWWSTTYYATTLHVQYSNDNITWANATGAVPVNGSFLGASVPQSFFFPAVSARYWRMFCVTGNNANFVVLSEMEVFSPGGAAVPTLIGESDADIIVNTDGRIDVTNNTGNDTDITIHYHV